MFLALKNLAWSDQLQAATLVDHVWHLSSYLT